MNKIKDNVAGIILVLIISYSSIFLNDLLKEKINLEAVTIAIIIGMIFGNTVGIRENFKSGIKFSLKKLLKVGIVLLGFKLNIYMLAKLGPKVLAMVIIYIPLALILAILLGRVFKVDTKLAALIGVGTSICGASAVVALAPCVGAEEEDSVVAVSIVSLLGAIGVLIYSAIANNTDITPIQYGVWSGISLHGVAHALAGAAAMGAESEQIGTIVKMTRVLMIVPVSVVLAFMFRDGRGNGEKKRADFPVYVLLFIGTAIINSLGIVPVGLTSIFTKGSKLFILMAMTSMGLSVDFKSIMEKGKQGLSIGSILFGILSVLSLVVILNII